MDEKKSLKRLLKLLCKQFDPLPISKTASSYKVAARTKDFSFSFELIKEGAEKKWIVLANNTIAITDEGKAVLVYALHPDMEFSAQHQSIQSKSILQHGAPIQVSVNENESPLSRLYYRRDKHGKSWIDEEEFKAGERLRSDFEKSQLQPRISANWEASVSSGGRSSNAGADISDFAVDARKRVENSIAALGPELSGVALDVCCFLKGLETVEKERLWPPRSAKLMLRTALRELVRHYAPHAPAKASSQTKHWGVEGYRPAMML